MNHNNNHNHHTKYKFNSHREFASGYLAACTSITLLFPLNKLIFRQILEGISFREAFAQLKREGYFTLYRGLLPPLIQKSTSYSIMFGTQHEYFVFMHRMALESTSPNSFIRRLSESKRNTLLTSLSAAMAGLTEATLTPLERVQAILQMQKYQNHFRHTWHVFIEISKDYGLKELYRGLSAICLRNSFSNVVFFTSRTRLKTYFPKADSTLKNTMYDFINGGVLGAVISTIFYPFNIIKSHMHARIGGKYIGSIEALRIVYESRDRRVKLMYKGVGSNFMRAVLAWGITNSTYELFLNLLKLPYNDSS
jgi:hypothetical protein